MKVERCVVNVGIGLWWCYTISKSVLFRPGTPCIKAMIKLYPRFIILKSSGPTSLLYKISSRSAWQVKMMIRNRGQFGRRFYKKHYLSMIKERHKLPTKVVGDTIYISTIRELRASSLNSFGLIEIGLSGLNRSLMYMYGRRWKSLKTLCDFLL